MSILIFLFAVSLALLVGIFVGLLHATPAALLDEVNRFQILISTFVAVATAVITLTVAHRNISAARIAKEEGRAHITDGLKAEAIHRIVGAVRTFGSLRYYLTHSPTTRIISDLENFVDDAERARTACQSCLTRAWQTVERARASDRIVVIDLLDVLENLSDSMPAAIETATATITADDASRAQRIEEMRERVAVFLHFVKEQMTDELKGQVDTWIDEGEKLAAGIDKAIQDPQSVLMAKPALPLFRNFHWSSGLFWVVVASAAAAFVSTIGLLATHPAYLKQVVQVWQPMAGPSSGAAPGATEGWKLNIVYPQEMVVDDDQQLMVSLSEVASRVGHDPDLRVSVEVTSDTFGINPDAIRLRPIDGATAVFSITANKTGTRNIRVVDRLWVADLAAQENPYPTSGTNEGRPRDADDPDARIITINVSERPVFMLIDRNLMSDIQVVATIIGIPGLLLFLLTKFLEKPSPRRHVRRRRSAA